MVKSEPAAVIGTDTVVAIRGHDRAPPEATLPAMGSWRMVMIRSQWLLAAHDASLDQPTSMRPAV